MTHDLMTCLVTRRHNVWGLRLSADTAEAVMSEGGPGAGGDLEPVTSGPAPECKQPHCDGNYRKINTERQNVECQNVD